MSQKLDDVTVKEREDVVRRMPGGKSTMMMAVKRKDVKIEEV